MQKRLFSLFKLLFPGLASRTLACLCVLSESGCDPESRSSPGGLGAPAPRRGHGRRPRLVSSLSCPAQLGFAESRNGLSSVWIGLVGGTVERLSRPSPLGGSSAFVVPSPAQLNLDVLVVLCPPQSQRPLQESDQNPEEETPSLPLA